jgi:shikimate dehydrogenase
MMRAAMKATGIVGVYVPFDVTPDRLGDAVRGLAALGFDGANVTVPHKVAVMEHLSRIDPAARGVGAVNTLVRAGEGFVGHNTDTEGLVATLRAHGVVLQGARAVVLGSGGAARAAAVGIALAGAQRVTVVARDPHPALTVTDAVLRATPGCLVAAHALGAPAVARAMTDASVVLQATSCGMQGGPSSDALLAGADLSACRPGTAAMDLVYVPSHTPWLEAAARAKLRVLADAGAEMLVRQGAASFARWTGREAPLDAMRDALRS